MPRGVPLCLIIRRQGFDIVNALNHKSKTYALFYARSRLSELCLWRAQSDNSNDVYGIHQCDARPQAYCEPCLFRGIGICMGSQNTYTRQLR